MITYVNTVLVGTGAGVLSAAPAAATAKNTPSTDAGKFIVMSMDGVAEPYGEAAQTAKKFRIGVVTKKNTVLRDKDGNITYVPVIKWSNPIKREDIVSNEYAAYKESTEDTITIDFTKMSDAILTDFQKGERRIIVRLTFKDLPTRYRKWTESYEYVTTTSDTKESIVKNIALQINKQYKRARVVAKADVSADSYKLVLTAMPYDDDDVNDSLNWADKVRFSANVYYTDPTAPAFASKNKYTISGVVIEKTPGEWYQNDAKLVRDRESQAMGYQGILNRGCCTWPIIKPDMVADITKKYDGATIMFENHYHAADDQIRQTKETIEIYGINNGDNGETKAVLAAVGLNA